MLEVMGQIVVPHERALIAIAEEMKSAYEERIACGRYDRDKERSDLRTAFLNLARRKGLNRTEARECWRRWF